MNDIEAKTLAEQEAGRRAVEDNFHNELAEYHVLALRQRFGKYISGVVHRIDDHYEVDVYITTASGKSMVFRDSLRGFPSDELVAQLALVM